MASQRSHARRSCRIAALVIGWLMEWADHLVYALAWLSFGIGHSLLAGAKRHRGFLAATGRFHRITYNAIAIVHLGLVLALGRFLAIGSTGFQLPFWLVWLENAMSVAGLALGIAALSSYRAAPFLGLAQLRNEGDEDEPLVLDGLHRWVRHPLYSASFLILWGLARSQLGIATAVWASLYLIIGSRIEERRLVARYGEAYRAYRLTTPAFLPRFFRI